ncbi:MAG: hypothetical protein J7647_32360 [Cyanobacteria bacterium SBLK]|nr:hypothetical protein [Cyanobacteria bacterium SBLK]
MSSTISIGDLVQQALTTGYLTVEAEEQLRYSLHQTQYGLQELRAFMTLQQATMDGLVKQQSREQFKMQN